MLRPQDNIARETKRLDGLWDFRLDAGLVGRTEGWWRSRLPQARPMPVPASYNDVTVDPTVHDHVGDAWYQRTVFVPRGWHDGRVVLRFDAATHRAAAWIDDDPVVEHEGGYTPFEADVTALLRPGQPHRLTVVVNNELSWQSIPPGIVELKPDGSRQQRYYHDFFNYAGLPRSVWLYTTPATHISDVTVVTDVEKGTGVVRCTTLVEGSPAPELRLVLRDATGEVAAEASGTVAELRLADPELWRPGRGYLYDLTIDLIDCGGFAAAGGGSDEVGDGGRVLDRYTLPVGIRTVAVEGTRFLINGEPFYFRGFGMHEDLALRGKGHDPVAMVHDFELLHWVGANSFRTSHYPYAEEVLEHADRLGLVVIDETAAVGLNLGVGGGLFLGGPKETFSEGTINDATQAVHARAVEELIARDKNHPSVVLWSIANEPESHSDESVAYFTPLFASTRALDPTRPVGFVNVLLAPPHLCQLTALADVVMLNRYYGWYIEPGDLVAAERALEAELVAWADKHGKPIIVTEYGADAVPGLHSVEGAPWTEEFQAALLETYQRVFDRVDAVVGEHVWNFADFATAPSFIRVEGNKKGVFSRDRRPKAAAHLLRRRWRADL
jgi:beta-glucuronidase